MTVAELIGMLQQVNDKEMDVLFYLGSQGDQHVFQTPCPAETGVIEIGSITPSVSPDGEVHDMDVAGQSMRVFALMPHNENNPHGDENDTGNGESTGEQTERAD